MKVLILGASGLIGHKLLQKLSNDFEVVASLHKMKAHYNNLSLFKGKNIIEGIDARNFTLIKDLLNDFQPDIILNCIGITKRKENISDLMFSIELNSLLPHKLAAWARENNKKVIHFSTDCVFDGKHGNYNEESLTTAIDNYGKTKSLGEIIDNHNLTIRSSFIGQELFGKTELLDWFLLNEGKKIKGYTKTLYSGVSTIFMSKIVKKIILSYPKLSGLFQLAPNFPISKYDLLCIARDVYNIDIEIIPDHNIIHKPTLNGSKLRKMIDINVPNWSDMMKELADEKNFYN